MKINKKVVLFCLMILNLLSLVRFLDNADYWLVDIFSQFSVQYAFCALFLLAICLWKKITSLAIFAGVLFAFNISVLADFGSPAQASGQEHDTFKVYSANINKSNNNFTNLLDELMKTDADIVLLLEVTERNIDSLKTFIESYPYHIVDLNIESSGTGIVLMSKFAMLNKKVRQYSGFGNMMISAELEILNKKVMFYATHFPKPSIVPTSSVRSMQFMTLAREISGRSVPVIVAGDLNTTPNSPIFRKFMNVSGLKDSREGFGWLPSWPTWFPPMWIPIDHILTSSTIKVHKRATGAYIGSDHYPVFAELSIH